MNPPPASPSTPSTRTMRGTSASQKKQSAPSTPVWRKQEGTHPSRSHQRSPISPMSPPLSVKKSPGAPPGSPGTLLGKDRHRRSRSSIAVPTSLPPPPMGSPSRVSQRKRVSGVPPPSPRLSSTSLPGASTSKQHLRVSGVSPPSPRSASTSLPGATTLKPHLIPHKMQIKPATAPAPPQNAIQRIAAKLSQSRKEKKAEKKEREERLLQ
jgi:hypothetical protein